MRTCGEIRREWLKRLRARKSYDDPQARACERIWINAILHPDEPMQRLDDFEFGWGPYCPQNPDCRDLQNPEIEWRP